MATATSGAFTATMTFATATQAGYWDRYQATLAALKAEIATLESQLNAGTIGDAEYASKMACLVDLTAQAIALWDSLRPVVAWS